MADRLNFGEVWENSHFGWVLPITNHGPRDVEIEQFRASCTCSQIEPRSLVIPAGQTREVRLTLDLSPKQPKEAGSSVRDFDVGIAPVVRGDPGSVRKDWWTIRGRVRPAILCDPPLVDFGRQSELAQPAPCRRTRLTACTPVRSFAVTCDSPNFDVKVQRSSAEAPGAFDLVVTPRTVLPRGETRCSVAVVPMLADGNRLPAKRVPVVERVVSDIEATPPTILLGACPVGGTATESLTLRSLSGRAFRVTSVRVEGAGLSVQSPPRVEAGGHTYEVKQKVSASGERTGRVSFSIRSGEKEDAVVVTVSHCGITSHAGKVSAGSDRAD